MKFRFACVCACIAAFVTIQLPAQQKLTLHHHDAAHQAGLGVGGWGKPGNSIGLQFAEGWARGM